MFVRRGYRSHAPLFVKNKLCEFVFEAVLMIYYKRHSTYLIIVLHQKLTCDIFTILVTQR